EEKYWKQKHRSNWLLLGDKNTKFFHRSVRAGQKRKRIDCLERPDGSLALTETEKGSIVFDFYKTLFTSEIGSNMVDLRPLHITPSISTVMNSILLKDVSDSEISSTVFAISPTKAPGPDGFTGLFFQKYWDIIQSDVSRAIKDFFRSNRMLPALNHTWLTLIPKTSDPRSIKDLRPIGLCTVIYKIISKIITSRLSKILPHIINPCQNGFIKARSITDNILLAHELLHHFKCHSGSQHYMAFKIDMEKAYARVEWTFLLPLLGALGFAPRFICLLHACLSSATMKVLVNGTPYGFFSPTRGVRQGDPLSPLLFALCSEWLSLLIQQAILTNSLCGIGLNSHCPKISHLMFADDTILFLKVTRSSIQVLKRLLQNYENMSGQRVNLTKSAARFSHNTPASKQTEYLTMLGVTLFDPR
ncbi:LINE-1 reverse transcriptase homolog, partial [Linum perenne]